MLKTAFLIIFSLSLFIANIYCFLKKKYIYLFIPCMMFLPEFYGIEISRTLPLITVTRMMFVVFYVYAIINRRRSIFFDKAYLKAMPKEYLYLAGYFIFRLVANLYYIATYRDALKTIFSLIFEQLFFLYAFYLLAPSKKELITLIKAIVWTATIIFLIGIFESFTFIKPFDALYTVSRDMLNSYYIRLGLLRSTATFGLPNFFSNACVLVLPLTLYLYNITESQKYLLCIFINIMGGIHSGSRAYAFILIMAMLFYLIFVLNSASDRIRFAKNTLTIFVSLAIVILLLSFARTEYRYYYEGTAKSLLNEVGFNYDLSEGSPDGIDGYGGNGDSQYSHVGGVNSRRAQLSGIGYTLKHSPIFGFGNGALFRDQIFFNFSGYWNVNYTIDVGIVEIVMYEGIIGTIAFIFLFCYLLLNKNATMSTFQSRIYRLSIFTYILCTLSTVNYIIFLSFFALYGLIQIEKDIS